MDGGGTGYGGGFAALAGDSGTIWKARCASCNDRFGAGGSGIAEATAVTEIPGSILFSPSSDFISWTDVGMVGGSSSTMPRNEFSVDVPAAEAALSQTALRPSDAA